MSEMICPFDNDIFCMIWEGFKRLYPEKKCTCIWDPTIQDNPEMGPFGATDFLDDGEIVVRVSPMLQVADASEVFAHELAHVAVGFNNDHNEVWKNAFDRIYDEYNRVAEERFPDSVAFNGTMEVEL